jgi:tetratricopeptide (TPR) repeat protein
VREAEDTGRPELIGLAKSRLAEKRMDENGLDEVEDHLLEALELLEESGEAGMGRVLLLEMLSSCCQRTGRPEKALEYLRSAIDLEREFRRNQRELDVVRLRLREAFERSERQRAELEEALESIRTLRELLPICARCKKIRNDEGYWEQIDAYISQHSDTVFSHGLCPDCLRELYPNLPSSETETEGGEG